MLRKFLVIAGMLSILVYIGILFVSVSHTPVHAQAVNVGPAGFIPPGPYLYGAAPGTPGALPTCTITAPSMDGALALISNQSSPIPSPTAGGQGYQTPVATASTGQQVALVKCHAVSGLWGIIP